MLPRITTEYVRRLALDQTYAGPSEKFDYEQEYETWLRSVWNEGCRAGAQAEGLACQAALKAVEARMVQFEDLYCGDDGSPLTLISDIRADIEAALKASQRLT